DTHPLALELTSLRTTVTRFQAWDFPHTTSIKLQRQSLDATRAHDRLFILERENDVLRKEIVVLRAYPHPDASPDAHPAVSQVKQLSLSLRQLSDKLSLTEEALLARTADLTHALSKAKRAMLATDSARELVMRMHRRQEEDMAREREVRLKLRTAKEQINMSDLVVKEYADLVRSLEGKLAANHEAKTAPEVASPGGSSHTPLSSLAGSRIEEGKLGLQRLVSEFAEESDRLQREIAQLQNELSISKARLEAQKKTTELHRLELAKIQTQLQKLKIDDNTAAKMVSRYMRFSQMSTDTLHTALGSLKARHAATVDTLSTQVSSLTRRLQETETTCERLRSALDELGGDYMKESYGRRREVTLRIKLIHREESLIESLRRWTLRAQEALNKAQDVPAQESLTKMLNEAKDILISTNGPESQPFSGSLARIVAVQTIADSLAEKLHAETVKRLELERLLAIGRHDQEDKPFVNIHEGDYRENSTQYEEEESSVAIQTSTFQGDEVLSPPMVGLPSIDFGVPTEVPNRLPEQLASFIPSDQDCHQDNVLKSGLSSITGESGGVDGCETIYPDAVELPTQDISAMEEQPSDETSPIGVPIATTRAQGQDAFAKAPVPEIVVAHFDDIPQSLLLSSDEHSHAEEPYFDAVPVPDIPSIGSDIITNLNSTVPQDNLARHIVLPSLDPQLNHPLLLELVKVNHRYDDLQRNLHDCHFALDALKQSLSTSLLNHQIPSDALKMALERLTDHIEDARVELEIRIADESLLARGYETLLSVPGALASKGQSGSETAPLRSEVELQVEAFVSGTEPSVRKALESLTQKLSVVQHDIAVLKRAFHDPEDEGPPVQHEPVGSPSPLFGPVSATAPIMGSRSGGWASWISSSPSRPSSPAPTFGNIMTSPRLRHSPSLSPGKPYLFNSDAGNIKDPLASLGLRVPMPLYVPLQTPAQPTATTTSRTVSTMYMIGLGARTASGSFTSLLSPHRAVSPTSAGSDGRDG
ncbi:hypothetical protein F5887DRAFT_1208425, partial [Amanita rubescens]